MQLRRAVLPAPFGPIMASISLSRISVLTSTRAWTPPKLSESLSIRNLTSLPDSTYHRLRFNTMLPFPWLIYAHGVTLHKRFVIFLLQKRKVLRSALH